ncbi:hypothetical protein ACIHDR_11440 [Nocardia sp. NPDC052278]|uniref:hypothetical protein n=1 Tax=unclassified Nocardia TaxID=2637762 RepID=UPI00368ACAD8
MGDWFQNIVDVEATDADAAELSEQIVAWLVVEGIIVSERTDCVLDAEPGYGPGPNCLRAAESPVPDLRTNGMSALTGRHGFDAGEGAFPETITCPSCAAEIRLDPVAEDEVVWVYAGVEARTCPGCSDLIDYDEWVWPESYFVWGHLGFRFWNWPPLRPEFIAELGRRLGHRTVLQEGKL